jgi:hypothetical protein
MGRETTPGVTPRWEVSLRGPAVKEISEVLRTAFTYVGYPVVILGIFVFIIAMIGTVFSRRRSLRAATAAILPVAALVFIIITESEPTESLANIVNAIPGFLKFGIGAIAAIALLELGKRLLEADAEVGPPLYVLFLSTTGVFILYAIMSRLLASIHVLLFGFVIGGGMQIIFRGGPEHDGTENELNDPIDLPHAERGSLDDSTSRRRVTRSRTSEETRTGVKP